MKTEVNLESKMVEGNAEWRSFPRNAGPACLQKRGLLAQNECFVQRLDGKVGGFLLLSRSLGLAQGPSPMAVLSCLRSNMEAPMLLS